MMNRFSKKKSSKIQISDIKDITDEKWNEFVYNHPNGNVFQTKYYYELHNKKSAFEPFGIGLLFENEIYGVVLGATICNFIWPINIFTKRSVIIGGPLVKDNSQEVYEYLMEYLTQFLKNKAIYIQIRNLWDMKEQAHILSKYGFKYEHHLDIIHDLTESTDTIKTKISKNKRGNVSKSLNKGTTFVEITDFDNFSIGVELIKNTYKKVGLPCPSKDYFYDAFHNLSKVGILKSFSAVVDGQIIGVRLELCYKDLVYDWYAGSDDHHKNKYPNDFLPFQILFWGKEQNYKKFDFGGAGKPDKPYGVREHKLKFGGELVDFGRYEKINQKIVMFLSKLAFSILQSVKKKQ